MSSLSGASTEAIQDHYDIDNDFYKLWLDKSMVYSCALYTDECQSLEDAQLKKIDYHIDNLNLSQKARVLDIGCGWGALLDRLVERFDAMPVGLTLSQAQHDWIQERIQPTQEVRLENWQNHKAKELYDGIVSIGAFEHFAEFGTNREEKISIYRRFFEKSYQLLQAEGRLSLQTIVYERHHEDNPNNFVKEIFPESDLPRLSDILKASEQSFEIINIRNDRIHYQKTLQAWYKKLVIAKDEIIDKYGEELYKKYHAYLGIFVIGFKTGTVNLSRICMQKID